MFKRRISIIVGLSIILMALAAGVGYGFVHNELFVLGNSTLTFQNIQDKNELLILSFISWVVIIATDVIVSWGLYRYFRSYNKGKAFTVSGLRLIYTLILTLAVIQLFRSYFQKNAEDVYQLIESFETIWFFGLIIFGAHLYYLGRTSCCQKIMPLWINGLLVIAGIGYCVLHVGKIWFVDSVWVEYTEFIMVIPMSLSEIVLAIWLLVKGGKS
jgi:hypothetical protein